MKAVLTPLVVALALGAASPSVIADTDAGVPALVDGGVTDAHAPDAGLEPAPSDDALIREAYRGVTDGNWFLVAGALLGLLSLYGPKLASTRWPKLARPRWHIGSTAIAAGVAGVAHAWLSGEQPNSHTLEGGIKVFVTALVTYAVFRRFVWGPPEEGDDTKMGPA